jgi:hypothetical protein
MHSNNGKWFWLERGKGTSAVWCKKREIQGQSMIADWTAMSIRPQMILAVISYR